MVRYYRKRSFQKSNSNNLTAVGNQIARDSFEAQKRVSRGSFF